MGCGPSTANDHGDLQRQVEIEQLRVQQVLRDQYRDLRVFVARDTARGKECDIAVMNVRLSEDAKLHYAKRKVMFEKRIKHMTERMTVVQQLQHHLEQTASSQAFVEILSTVQCTVESALDKLNPQDVDQLMDQTQDQAQRSRQLQQILERPIVLSMDSMVDNDDEEQPVLVLPNVPKQQLGELIEPLLP